MILNNTLNQSVYYRKMAFQKIAAKWPHFGLEKMKQAAASNNYSPQRPKKAQKI